MNVGDLINVTGCVTKEKFLAGRPLVEIEKILGFHPGRLRSGTLVVALLQLPRLDQFELAAYSNVATHRLKVPTGLDIQKLKIQARASWTLTGPDRLVKLLPTTRHDPAMNPDVQYPPGHGAPQWSLTAPMPAKVVAVVTGYPGGRYIAADVARLRF